MVIKGNDLFKFAHGALCCATDDTGTRFCRFTPKQEEYIKSLENDWYNGVVHSAGVSIKFVTDADRICLDFCQDYINYPAGTFDLFCDGILKKSVTSADEKSEPLTSLDFDLDGSEHKIEIYLPNVIRVFIKSLTLSDGASIKPVPKGKVKALLLGDSITEGYGCSLSSHSYANRLTRLFGWDSLNQGIGGYVFDAKGIPENLPFTPDVITVAFGTNHYNLPTFDAVTDEFFKVLDRIYPNIPTFVMTPLWRGGRNKENFAHAQSFIKDVCGRYDNIFVSDGMEAVPHIDSVYIDRLHPNTAGSILYADYWYPRIKAVLDSKK